MALPGLRASATRICYLLETKIPYDFDARDECLQLLDQVALAEELITSLTANKRRSNHHDGVGMRSTVTLPEVVDNVPSAQQGSQRSTERQQPLEPLRLLSPPSELLRESSNNPKVASLAVTT